MKRIILLALVATFSVKAYSMIAINSSTAAGHLEAILTEDKNTGVTENGSHCSINKLESSDDSLELQVTGPKQNEKFSLSLKGLTTQKYFSGQNITSFEFPDNGDGIESIGYIRGKNAIAMKHGFFGPAEFCYFHTK